MTGGSADLQRRNALAENGYRDATRAVVDVRTVDPAELWRWLDTLQRDRLYCLVICLACWVDANETPRQLDRRINDVVEGTA